MRFPRNLFKYKKHPNLNSIPELIGHEGSTVLVCLNDLRLLPISLNRYTDHPFLAKTAHQPSAVTSFAPIAEQGPVASPAFPVYNAQPEQRFSF